MFRKAIDIDSNFSYMFGKYIHTKMHICNWNNYYNDLKKLEIEIKNNKKVIEPFPLLSLIDDMDIQKKMRFYTVTLHFKILKILN